MDPPAEVDGELDEQRHQQEVIAEFGRRALETDDLGELMHEASTAVANALDTEYGLVLEHYPDRTVVQAGVGWQDTVDEQAEGVGELESHAWSPLRSDGALVIDDVQTDERFSALELLTSHDVVSAIGVGIGPGEKPWGMLWAFASERREFTAGDAAFVESIANTLWAAIESSQTKRRLREREHELEQTFERISDAFFALDADWRVTYVNERAETLLGSTEAELRGENVWDEFPNADEQAFKPQYERAMETQEPVRFEEYAPSISTWVEVDAYPSETGLSVYFRDVSERKARERELEETTRLYRTLVENFPNGVVALVDEELRYLTFGGTLEGETERSRTELEGRPLRDVLPEAVGETVIPHYEAALEGESARFESEIDDEVYRFHFCPVRDEDGDVFAALCISQNVTDRVEYQRKLEESNERLEQFAYAASHDLQEPLRMVSTYLQLIERRYGEVLDDDGEEFLAFAVEGADRMREMVSGLLEYSRVETKAEPLEPVDLNDVLDDVVETLQVRIHETDAELAVESLPRVRGDARQLRQVFQNLLGNAIQYSGEDRPQIHVSATRDGTEWTVSVRDEGIGIDPDDHDSVFQIFHRLHSSDEHSGAGIGLALCKRIVERHGGEIWLDAAPGEGTTVSVTLPAVDE